MSGESGSTRRAELDAICKDIAISGEGALAFAVAETESGGILGFHGEKIAPSEMSQTVKGVLALFRSPDVAKVRAALLDQGGIPGSEPFQELRLVTASRGLYAKVSGDGRRLFLLVTEASVAPGWGWKEIRSAQRRLESTV
ncbi:MAG: hypothetical protein L6R30_08165 [Thermoanaerobaculia bacterium]|nr:hypothetical protein [Thermoanaerobaculia bacterium]